MNDAKIITESLLAESIGVLMKVYAMTTTNQPLSEKTVDHIEGIIDTYMEMNGSQNNKNTKYSIKECLDEKKNKLS